MTKRIQTKLGDYFSSVGGMTRPEVRCLRDMAVGILKSKTVFVNRIAASLREPLKMKDVCKRLSSQYLKRDYAGKVLGAHLDRVCPTVGKDGFIVMDGTDISKKYSKFMEGLEFVRNGDTGGIGLGYNVLNINAVGTDREITPLYSKAYSYEMGAPSSNNEVKKAVRAVNERLDGKGCWVFDRGADNAILKDFFTGMGGQCIIRLKKNTGLRYKGEDLKVSQIAQRIESTLSQKAVKVKKEALVTEVYDLAAVPVTYRTEKGAELSVWLVISRNRRHGGLCYLLVKSDLETSIEVAKRSFKGYGLRWKIEEYHRHVKSQYGLEDVQMRTFDGLQSVLAVLTVAMYMVYRKLRALHFGLLLDCGYNYLNRHTPRELVNFIYYKVGKVVSNLLMPVRMRWKPLNTERIPDTGQLDLMFN